MRFLLEFAWRKLRAESRGLGVFCACLALGVALVAAGGGLYRQVAEGLRAEARALFGGDVEVRSRRPLGRAELEWMHARGQVSLLVELRTMLRTPAGRVQLIELQSADARYPLYGEVTLSVPGGLAGLLAPRDGVWGAALDEVLAQRLGLREGDRVEIGELELQVRARVLRQPDRSLRADWNGAPVLVADGALQASGLAGPLSRVDYRYRVRTAEPAARWRAAFVAAFPGSEAQPATFEERGERMAQVLEQLASGLLLIGFSALFIGGLGVCNSVQAWLQGQLATLATLRALGLRDARLAALVLLQLLMLAGLASLAGALAGGLLALGGTALAAGKLPLAPTLRLLAAPLLTAWAFGLLTALVFALPPLGRALSVAPAALFRGFGGAARRTPAGAWVLSGLGALLIAALVIGALPDARFGLAFVGALLALLLLLEGLLRGLRRLSRRLLARPGWQPAFELRLALAALQRPDSPLRAALLSLGAALTLLVACTLVVAALLRAIHETVPQQMPALVFHDVQTEQLSLLRSVLASAPGPQRLQTAPLVLGRLVAVNGEALRDGGDRRRARAAREEHKLSDRRGDIDGVVVTQGAWWPAGYRGPPLVAMEDREAAPLGLAVGDRLRFDLLGTPVEARLAAIYRPPRWRSRLWLEGIFSDGVLDPFITRHVGAAHLPDGQAVAVQERLAAQAPDIVSVRTEALLRETRALMARAGAGLAVVAGVCLAASLLVLASVVAASRARLVYEASVMHALGARLGSLRRTLQWEYALLALLTTGFAVLMGSALATALLRWRLELEAGGLYWTGVLTAGLVSGASLGLGARHLLARLRLTPALLLRAGG